MGEGMNLGGTDDSNHRGWGLVQEVICNPAVIPLYSGVATVGEIFALWCSLCRIIIIAALIVVIVSNYSVCQSANKH